MIKTLLITTIFITLMLFFGGNLQNKTPESNKLIRGIVADISPIEKNGQSFQKVFVRIHFSGEIVEINHGEYFTTNESQKVQVGDEVILSDMENITGTAGYYIADKYRLDYVYLLFVVFLLMVVALSGTKGVGSTAGMVFSVLVIVKYVVPQILGGSDPLFVSIVGSILILIVSIYLAHGFSTVTTVAVVSTSITLVVTGLLSVLFVQLAGLSGLGSEDALSLQIGMSDINFKGLLLGGMIIGFLGVLDDITTSMSATVFELKKVNSKLSFKGLIQSSLTVGREHISSLVNTLVLAYAGASLPLFIFIVQNPQNYPLWFILNSEMISEEIVRTLVGSVGLLLAVPITAVLAAKVVSKKAL